MCKQERSTQSCSSTYGSIQRWNELRWMCLDLCPSQNLEINIYYYFSKWTEAFPMGDQEATTITEILVREVISRFGVPLSLHSDQGQNFESTVFFSEMCRLIGVEKTWLEDKYSTRLHLMLYLPLAPPLVQ